MKKSLRKAVIAGNWKMNNNKSQTETFMEALKPLVSDAQCDVVLCVPFTDLSSALEMTKGSNIKIGAQNVHWAESGAFTGEISTSMLRELGVEYVIVGHSERRQFFGETNETVNQRLLAALDAGLTVILCVGELLDEREKGITNEICALQTKVALSGVTAEKMDRIIIAYEPVWAIGTGKTATADQAEAVCAFIRTVVAECYTQNVADKVPIQYGGSMNAQNADELLGKENVDGGLIGGASLKAPDFAAIIKAASK